MKPGNILMVWDRMGDYHRARWKAVASEIPGVKVYAADLGGSDSLYQWSNTEEKLHCQLSKKSPGIFDFARLTTFIKLLSTKDIRTICIAGYGRPEYLFFLFFGKLTGRTVILFAESWYTSSGIVDKLKAAFLKFCCDGYLVSGERAKQHFINRFNINESLVKIGYSVVDNDHFVSPPRTTFHKRILCVARFAPEKNLEVLIKAFHASHLPPGGWQLLLVGGGPLQDQLKLLSDGKSVMLMPWKPYNLLPEIYHSASVFVLPSSFEPWGLVVNEAMAAGLPIVLSNETGCVPDLLTARKNGWPFTSSDETELCAIFNEIAGMSPQVLTKMGEESNDIVSKYGPGLFARNLKALISRKL